jgi:hypothetical protein
MCLGLLTNAGGEHELASIRRFASGGWAKVLLKEKCHFFCFLVLTG